MWFAYLDASALVKRYTPETGTAFLNHLFLRIPPKHLIVFSVGVAEVVSILTRKANAGILSVSSRNQAITDFLAEIHAASQVRKVHVDEALVTFALPLIPAHSINSTDALLLASAKEMVVTMRASGDDLLLVAADKRLVRAATAEGLTAMNPETATIADLNALLGP